MAELSHDIMDARDYRQLERINIRQIRTEKGENVRLYVRYPQKTKVHDCKA